MHNYYPILIIFAAVGVISALLLFAYFTVKDKKEAFGFERNMKDGEIIKRLFAYAKPYRGRFLLAFFIMLISVGYDVAAPLIVGYIQEMIKSDFELSRLFAFVALYASILLVSLVCTYIQAMLLQRVGQKIVSTLRADVFSHIESLSHSQLNHIPVGVLVTRVANDTNHISRLFTHFFVNLAKNIVLIIGVFVAMLYVNFQLTLIVLSFVPFVILFTVVFRKLMRREFRRVKDATTDINVFLSENLSGIKITQIFGREQKKREQFEQRNNRLDTYKRRRIFVQGVFRPLVYMLYLCSVLCLFYFGAKGYIDGTKVFGQAVTSQVIVSFYMYVSKFYTPIQNLAEQFQFLQMAFASAEKVFSILDIKPEIVDSDGAIELQEMKGNIEFRNVWFAYEGENWVLRDVSFKVNAGEVIALVGATGSGKTTILSLICRNYDVNRGEILIDGVNIKSIKISSLRRHMGQMLQDVFLFSGTIRSNITLGNEAIGDEEVIEACRYVNADSFINKLTSGIDEPVRERGNNFSQGQRQLLSFARTVIHKPAVMILDEATANIDTETELLIQDSLEKMMNIGTMLMVAHRLSTIQHADNIIVLSHGEIIEQGNHFELLEKRGRYYDLYMLQYRKNELQKQLDSSVGKAIPEATAAPEEALVAPEEATATPEETAAPAE